MHSHVSHAAFSRSRYSNFVSRTALKWLHLLSCNTLRISFGFVIIYCFKYWRPECKENPLLNGLFWIYSSRMGSAEGWFARVPGCCTSHVHYFTLSLLLPLPCLTDVWLWLCDPRSFTSLSEFTGVTRRGINWAAGWQ